MAAKSGGSSGGGSSKSGGSSSGSSASSGNSSSSSSSASKSSGGGSYWGGGSSTSGTSSSSSPGNGGNYWGGEFKAVSPNPEWNYTRGSEVAASQKAAAQDAIQQANTARSLAGFGAGLAGGRAQADVAGQAKLMELASKLQNSGTVKSTSAKSRSGTSVNPVNRQMNFMREQAQDEFARGLAIGDRDRYNQELLMNKQQQGEERLAKINQQTALGTASLQAQGSLWGNIFNSIRGGTSGQYWYTRE